MLSLKLPLQYEEKEANSACAFMPEIDPSDNKCGLEKFWFTANVTRIDTPDLPNTL
jgi:hypothetical protein